MVGIKLSGDISANDMFQEFKYYGTGGKILQRPAGDEVAMDKYNRTSLALGGVVPINDYNRNVGELLLDNSWSDYYGARRNPVIMDTRISIPDAAPFGGCAAAGYRGVNFYFKRTGQSFMTWQSIYGRGGSLAAGTKPTFATSTLYDARSGFLRDQVTTDIHVLTGITDPVSFRLQFRISAYPSGGGSTAPTEYQVKITADCKGGGRGYYWLAKDWTNLNLFQDGTPTPDFL